MPDTPRLRVPADLASLDAAIAFARRAAEESGLPEECFGNVDLVVEEIFVNIVRYAYPDGKDGVVEISDSLCKPGLLSIEISDHGAAYNPLTLREPNLPASLNERAVGGLGILLVRQLTKALHYNRDGEWNRLRFEISI